MVDEWQMVRETLSGHGVAGADDLGRFVSNTKYFRPSALDEHAAMPIFIELLPQLSDPTLVAVLASHLRRRWARPRAFDNLHAAFERWAIPEPTAGWHIGDALATTATKDELPVLLRIAAATKYGKARQMIVDCLWRFNASDEVETTLVSLIRDPDVALHAMSALRRTIGAEAALPHLRQVQDEHSNDLIGTTAKRQIQKAEAKLTKDAR